MAFVNAEGASARGGEIEEHKAEEDCSITLVLYGEETLRHVGHEIGRCHLAGENEGGDAGEEASSNQRAAHEFQNASYQHQCWKGLACGEIISRWPMKKLGHAVFEKQQAGDDAERRVQRAGPGGGDNSG